MALRQASLEALMPKHAKASLLLVDDDPDLLRLLSIRLKANGYDVTAVDSGQRALASIAASRPDLLLTDLRMEKVDGMQLLRACREKHPEMEVVMITGFATAEA
ncbi:MAG TPA: response regulator, partial [Usitatibacter sp.]|nr:response regulator [Usitatibacter sp.]